MFQTDLYILDLYTSVCVIGMTFTLLPSQLKSLGPQTLDEYISALDKHMSDELESLRKRYHQKRLPILQAMDAKKKHARS